VALFKQNFSGKLQINRQNPPEYAACKIFPQSFKIYSPDLKPQLIFAIRLRNDNILRNIN